MTEIFRYTMQQLVDEIFGTFEETVREELDAEYELVDDDMALVYPENYRRDPPSDNRDMSWIVDVANWPDDD